MSPFAQSDGMPATADGRFREKPTRERPSRIGPVTLNYLPAILIAALASVASTYYTVDLGPK